jgi:hypothetical protein
MKMSLDHEAKSSFLKIRIRNSKKKKEVEITKQNLRSENHNKKFLQ